MTSSAVPVKRRAPSGAHARPRTVLPCDRRASGVHVAVSHSRTVVSRPPEANTPPSGLQPITRIDCVWPSRTTWSARVFTSQTRTRKSSEPPATSAPSGEIATVHIALRHQPGERTASSTPRAVSQARAVPSRLPETSRRPSVDSTRLVMEW